MSNSKKIKDITRWTVAILTLALALGPFTFEPGLLWPVSLGVPRAKAVTSTCGWSAATYNSASGTCRGFLTSTSTGLTWTVPTDWNNSSNTIEVIGGGGGGSNGAGTGSGGGGGGGGAYAKVTNWASSTPSATVNYMVGIGGRGTSTSATAATGTITFFNWAGTATSTCSGATSSVCANGGSPGIRGGVGGLGGASSTSVGATRNAGGRGGNQSSNTAAGGGGGAAGPNANGNYTVNTTSTTGGQGDGTSGGTGGTGGSPGNPGNPGQEWDSTHGSGGGGGGATASSANGGAGGGYGGGGGGGSRTGGAGGNASSGIIVITYTPITDTLGNGTQPASRMIGPTTSTVSGVANATTSTVFTLTTSAGTSTIASTTVSVSTSTGIYQVLITDNGGTTVYGSSTNPGSSSFDIPIVSTMNVSSSQTTFKILISPDSYGTMPTSPGDYAVTSTVSNFKDNKYLALGANTTSSVITIDNSWPGTVTNASGTAASGQVALSWTNPSNDANIATTTILRATSTVTQTPSDGTYYNVNNTIGTSTVACVVLASSGGTGSCMDTNVVNGTTYYYAIFNADTFLSYSVSSTPSNQPFTPSAANPQISSAANQTFTVGTTNVMSAITVTSTAASQITAANGIRITLATSSGAPVMFWNTSVATATISGTGNVSTTANYADGSSTLVLTVNSDFANASSVTISGLQYVVSSTVNAATTTRDLRWQGAGQASPIRDTKTVTVIGSLALQQHSAGQEANAFTASATSSNAALFAFQLQPTGEPASTTVDIQLSGITGIAASQISGATIYKDVDANGGAVDASDTAAWSSGSVSISGSTGDINFTTPFQISNTTTTRFILVATTSNLLAGNTITYSLGASNLNATGTTVGLALTPTNGTPSLTNAVHTVSAAVHTQRSSRWQNDDGANVNSDSNMEPADTAVTSTYLGQRLTLRMQIDNTGGGDPSGRQYSLQYQVNSTSGSWTDVASGNAIEPALGTAGANNDAITSAVAASNSNTFTNGAWTKGTNAASSTTLFNNYYTEEAYMIDTSAAASGTTYYFRVASGTSAIDAYSAFPSLQTVSSTNNTIQYSKQASGASPSGTSSLAYFFDAADYSAVTASDTSYAAITATSTNAPVFLFKSRATTSTFPVRIDWTGQESAASTTYVDIYDTVAKSWVNLTSTSSPPANTNFTLTGNATTSPARFYDSDSFGNFWTYVRVRQNTASTTATLKIGQIAVNFEPTAGSAAGQTFTVNDSATAMSQIAITASPDTPVIATSTGIRIMIPTSLNMLWATSTTSATLGGTASGKTSSTVSYLDGGRTLKVNVTSTYAAGDTLTISGLSFTNFTSGSASATLWAFYNGATGTVPDAVDSFGKIVRGILDLNNHPAGQETNQLNVSQTSVTKAPILDFQATTTGETATTTQVVFNLTNITGFGTNDVTSTQIVLDTNGNGVVDAGEPTVMASGTTSIANGAGTITFTGTLAVTSTMNLILIANITNNNPGNGLTVSLAPSGIASNGQTSLVALTAQGTNQSATHSRPSTKGGGGGGSGGPPPSVPNQGGGAPSGGTTPSGGGAPSAPPVGGGTPSGGGGGSP